MDINKNEKFATENSNIPNAAGDIPQDKIEIDNGDGNYIDSSVDSTENVISALPRKDADDAASLYDDIDFSVVESTAVDPSIFDLDLEAIEAMKPDSVKLEAVYPEVEAVASETVTAEPENVEVPEVEVVASETVTAEPEVAETPEVEVVASETVTAEPEVAEAPEVEVAASETVTAEPEAAEAPEVEVAASETASAEPEVAEAPEVEVVASETVTAEPEAAETSADKESKIPAADGETDELSEEPNTKDTADNSQKSDGELSLTEYVKKYGRLPYDKEELKTDEDYEKEYQYYDNSGKKSKKKKRHSESNLNQNMTTVFLVLGVILLIILFIKKFIG